MVTVLYSCSLATYFQAYHTVLNILHNALSAVCGIFHCQMLLQIILKIRSLGQTLETFNMKIRFAKIYRQNANLALAQCNKDPYLSQSGEPEFLFLRLFG